MTVEVAKKLVDSDIFSIYRRDNGYDIDVEDRDRRTLRLVIEGDFKSLCFFFYKCHELSESPDQSKHGEELNLSK